MNDNPDIETLDTYIRKVENQEIKGILLKLKNEIRKSDVTWESVKNILISLEQKDSKSAKEIFLLLLEKTD
ncbi:MAG: hypothetical protein V3R67_00965 [Thermodesulfobacteriota bacterium]|jgi:hypothetical protein|nr:hypothetical protein [Candidatus Dadabacteria bacterium]MCZ6865557.1 hypothetical protein [Candidatus Dadabacteria bacterium]